MVPQGASGWTISRDGAVAFIGIRGGICVNWTVPRDGEDVHLLDGYTTLEERTTNDGSRQSILAPWSNRVRDGRYEWDGREYDLGPDPSGRREGLHGLVEFTGFELKEMNDHRVRVCKKLDHEGYPQPLNVCLTYELHHDIDGDGNESWSLEHTTALRNLGDAPAPVGLGWNPHILWHGDRAGATIEMPASTRILTDDDLIPLPGDEAFEDLGVERSIIADPHDIERTWTDLTVDDDERVRMHVNHATGARTTLEATTMGGHRGQDVIHLSTGEKQRFRPGVALACEYSQFMPDAYNRTELHGALALAPGETRRLTTKITHRF